MPSPFNPSSSHGTTFNGGTITSGLLIDTVDNPQLRVEDGAGKVLLAAQPGSSVFLTTSGTALTVGPGLLKFEADDGTDLFLVHTSNNQIELSPGDGQVDALGGILRLAANAAPDDVLFFNGSFAFWLDTATPALKVKAKVGGVFKTGTVVLA